MPEPRRGTSSESPRPALRAALEWLPPKGPGPRGTLLAIVGATGLLLSVAAAGAAPPSQPDTVERQIQRFTRENDLLSKRLELAKGGGFYLLFDRPRSRLVLMLRSAVLQEWPVQGVEVGTPRVAFLSRNLRTDWQGRIWTKGALDPPREKERLVIEAPPPKAGGDDEDTEPAVPIPPTPEEMYPVPPRFLVRYDGGLSLEVRRMGDTAEERGSSLWGLGHRVIHWVADIWAVARPTPLDTVRLRLVLKPEDAASLYRALPPNTKLLVIPPE